MCEITQKVKQLNNMFDKYWYRQREIQYSEGISGEQANQFEN